MIRKNNFVLTKGGESSVESSHSPAANTVNSHGPQTRVQIPSMGNQASNVIAQKAKLNLTMHSNTSGNRALNNTQKILRTAAHAGAASNGSLASDNSLSQTRQNIVGPSLGSSLVKVSASGVAKQTANTNSDTNLSAKPQEEPIIGFGASLRKSSDPSLEKITNTSQQTHHPTASGSRLIKVNRSKKKLDSARRSRIQQLKDTTLASDHSQQASALHVN